jgi:hypothetical protein
VALLSFVDHNWPLSLPHSIPTIFRDKERDQEIVFHLLKSSNTPETMVSFDSPSPVSLPSRQVRAWLILASVIGVTLNIVMAALGRAKAEGGLGITFVSSFKQFPLLV